MPYDISQGDYLVSTDPARLDIDRIHAFLTRSYWAKGVSRDVVARSIDNSLPFGLYHQGRQVGFARVISDLATFAYLADVYVEEPHRGRGLSKLLVQCVMDHPQLQGLRRWLLGTMDAHGLYRRFGFREPRHPERWMERVEAHVPGDGSPP